MAQQAQTVALPKRWPLLAEPQNRDGTTAKDAKLVNCFVETQKTLTGPEYWLIKRAGISLKSWPSLTTVNGYGVFNWKGDIYSIFGATMYKNDIALVGALDTTGGVYVFDSCLGATPKLTFGNGVKAYNYDAGAGIVLIADPDFPAAFGKGWAYLDGTTYVMKTNAHIQGDDLNDPTSWPVGNDIVAQIESDDGVALRKQLVYVVAFKQYSTEVFFDAGNATGSPLGQVQGAKQNYGCLSADSIQDIDGTLIWLAGTKTAGNQVVMMESLKLEPVSTKPIERLLQSANFTTVYSFQVSLDGHRFYVVTMKLSNLTLAFDLDEREWHQWTDVNGNYFKGVASSYDNNSRCIMQHESDGKLYYVSQTYTNDADSQITVDIVTPLFDAGVQSRGKALNMMYFVGDKTPGSLLHVRKTDDDYKTWSNARIVDMSKSKPYLDACGTFDRRAYWLRHQSDTRMRLKACELQMDLCEL